MGSTLLSLRMIVVRSRLGILAELGHPDYTTSIYSITCRSRYLTLTLTPKILKWHGSLGRRYHDIGFQLAVHCNEAGVNLLSRLCSKSSGSQCFALGTPKIKRAYL